MSVSCLEFASLMVFHEQILPLRNHPDRHGILQDDIFVSTDKEVALRTDEFFVGGSLHTLSDIDIV